MAQQEAAKFQCICFKTETQEANASGQTLKPSFPPPLLCLLKEAGEGERHSRVKRGDLDVDDRESRSRRVLRGMEKEKKERLTDE